MIKPLNLLSLILCFSFLIVKNKLWSQNQIADSLQLEIEKTDDLKIKAELYLTQAEEMLGFSPEKSLGIIDKALKIGRDLKDRDIIGSSLIWKGRVLAEKNSLDSALQFLQEAEAIFNDPIDSFHLAKAYNAMGIVFKYKNQLEKAIEVQYKSAVISEALGMKHNAASTYNSIANIHSLLRDKPKAIEFYEKTIELLDEEDSPRGLAGALLNLANVIKDDPVKARQLYTKAEVIALKNNYNRILAYIYAGLANYYEEIKVNIDSQKVYYQKAIVYAELIKDPYMLAYNQLYLAILESNENPKEGEIKILNALESEYIKNSNLLKAEGNFYLSKSLYQQGKFKNAYIHLDTALNYYQENFDEDLTANISETNAKYETSKKETQLTQQKLEITQQELEIARQKQLRSYAIVTALALITLLAALFQYFFYRQKQKKQAAELALSAEKTEGERLREVDRLKSTFFTNISHELRTPLTLVAAPLEDALESVKPGLLKNHLQLAQSNTQKLLNLVNEILDLSKLEAGKIEAQNVAIALTPFCRRVFYSFESIAQLRGIDLVFETSIDDATNIQTDKEKLEKILNNLLSNAIKFTDTGGKVIFGLNQNQEHFLFEVSDTGSGIAPKELPRIFDRFYQSTSHNTPLQGGSGIGLALAKELAQLLGGDLQAQSSVGKGSQFTLHLPLEAIVHGQQILDLDVTEQTEPQEAVNFPSQYAPLLLNGQKPRLLIVEDNADMSRYLVQSLSEQYHCTTAPDGKAALEKLKDQSFDLITSDVMMPQMDGFTFREKVNEHLGWRQIPFIMLTARALEEDKLKGFHLGVDDYLTKPFNLKELKARIHNLLVNKIARDTFSEQETVDSESEEPSIEEQLLRDAEAYVLHRIDDPQLRVEDLAKALHFSSRHLSRTMSKLVGLTPVNFILELRLQKARKLLESRRFSSVAEVRYQIGIESASYFTTKFTERFGKNPKEYLS